MAQQTNHIGKTNKMVTAVEWLEKIVLSGNGRLHLTDEEFEQAKQMEKEQIKEAYKFGLQDEYVIGSEQYYNEIYDK
jgi:hypothetical protein